jgi:hypothetical protein
VRPGRGYLQARVQARYGVLPDPGTWRRVEPARELAAFIEAARATALAPWVAGVSASSRAQDMELNVRRLLLEAVDETAGWIGDGWRPALQWTGWLIDLPLVEHWRRGGSAPAWTCGDSRLQGLCGPDDVRASPHLAELLEAAPDERPLADAWLEVWRGRWPRARRGDRARLQELAGLVDEHRRSFATLEPSEAWAAREGLETGLRLLFRRTLLQPATAFCYLLLLALGLERLRGALVRRALFGAGRVPA